MWKLTCLLTAAFSAAFVAGSQGRFVSSPFQPAIPFGTAIKMTPDPSSIWSWHHDVTATGNLSIPIEIDIDGNGQPDTMDPRVRVLVTDVQMFPETQQLKHASLRDGTGDLWDLTNIYTTSGDPTANQSFHFSTPLAVAVGSKLLIDVQPLSLTGSYRVRVHLIGRVVNL
jgi:hypothetical protein